MAELIEINPEELDPDTLNAVVESFVLREGTDYGVQEASLDAKLRAVHTQLKNGKAKLVFDPETDSCTILLERDFKKALDASQRPEPL